MTDHQWVKMEATAIVVERDGVDLAVYIDDLAEELSTEMAMLGCWFCHQPLTTDIFDTACPAEAILPNALTSPRASSKVKVSPHTEGDQPTNMTKETN